jgi:hypothetical protein
MRVERTPEPSHVTRRHPNIVMLFAFVFLLALALVALTYIA